ncbi:RagB/SusD family nutrient uptake outer membrane protein [Labilibacter sediminis]|nr:RagB/SusD family nutrient uptake outer membrane protein [Labilibacter sediminis]
MHKYYILLIIPVWMLIGCSDFVIEEPITSQSDVATLSSYEGLDKATLGAYSPLYSPSWYGANFILSSELRAGNAKNPTNSNFRTGRYSNENAWNFDPTVTSPLWYTAYKTITSANSVIDAVDIKMAELIQNDDEDTVRYNNLKAECLFLRALGHFDLVRTYAQPYTYAPESDGVPIVVENISDNQPSRNTVAKVYEQVINDLQLAESIFDKAHKRRDVSDTLAVVSLPAIHAMLSRVYLNMGEWQKCADYATLVIDKKEVFDLWTTEQYTEVWTQDKQRGVGEVIFQVYGEAGASSNGFWDEISWIVNPDGYGDVAATMDLRLLLEEDDVRSTLFRSHPQAMESIWTNKYAGKNPEQQPSVSNIIVLRLSEMYLNRIEALYNGARISRISAKRELDKLTNARGASRYSTINEEIIFIERQKELCFEGHIVYDYARLNRSLVRNDYDGLINKDVPFPSYMWALPIPKREIDANVNMVQNDNY